MTRDNLGAGGERFTAYVDVIAAALGHADRIAPARAYCTGLLLPGERKSIEPLAARISPKRVPAAHQSLHHLIATADWHDEAVLAAVRDHVLPAIERHGPIRYWIVDDTGFPKKGKHSVGVARQYCGELGKQDNCQVAVMLAITNDHAGLPIAYRLYLPEAWANDPERRSKAGVPDQIRFQTKPEIALDQIRWALAAGVSVGVVLADAAYGTDTDFRGTLTDLGLVYVLAVQSSTSLWPPGSDPLPPKPWSGKGRSQRGCVVIKRTSQSRPRTSPRACPRRSGRRSSGARGAKASCRLGLLPYAFVRRIGTNPLLRNGC